MNIDKKMASLAAILALSFVVAQGAFAQTTDEIVLEDEILAVDEAAEEDSGAALLRLSVEFSVELVELQSLTVQGYTPGEIWLALEIQASSANSLQEAVVLAAGMDGHGWGVLAMTLGIDPGSEDFHALKATIGNRHTNNEFPSSVSVRQNAKKPKSDSGPKGKNGSASGRD
ncbi:MAG: hypothetical protein WBH97_08670 [Rectinemataceae bacterium]